MALPPQKLQIKRTQTDNNPPPDGTLAPGELSVEMGTPTRLWVGVPAAISATLKKLLFDSSIGYVLKSGDTMSGDLHVAKATPSVYLDKTASGQNAAIRGTLNGIARWVMQLGDTSAESGGGVGSDFVLRRFDDSGGSIDAPLTIARSNGRMLVNGDPTSPLGVATKQYVDARSMVLRSYLAGLTWSTPGGSANFTVSPGVACDSTNVDMMVLPAAMTKSTAAWAAGSGNGAMDTGTFQILKWYYFFVIKNPTTGVVDLLFSLSATAPTLPSGFTLFRRIAAVASGNTLIWQTVTQFGDEFWWTSPAADVVGSAVTNTAGTLFTISAPPGIKVHAQLYVAVAVPSDTLAGVVITSPDYPDIAAAGSYMNVGMSPQNSASAAISTYMGLTVRAVNGQVRARGFAATQTVNITTVGWIDRRGRDN